MQMRYVVGALILTLGASATIAQEDVVVQRRALMRANNAAAASLGAMIRGEAPFDAAAAQKAMATIKDNGTKIAGLFPPPTPGAAPAPAGSPQATRALPAIWTANDDFKARAAKLSADADAASQAADKGLDAFKVAFTAMQGTCNGCHGTYRGAAAP
ncbi:MAG: cytochrome c [Bauldia sp.]